MEAAQNRSLPFLHILVSRKPDGSYEHTMYRKPTCTDLYIHMKPAHHPEQKRAVLTTLILHVKSICNAGSLDGENEYLKPSGKMDTATRSITPYI
jgi:hypothetical protein